jgi:hypothetical protein
MSDSLTYVYGIVPAGRDSASAPPGIDETPVRIVGDGALAALVSTLDGASYAPERVEALAADVAWLGPRASAHDAVAVWASDRGAVVPLPIFTLFRDDEGVRAMLRERAGVLAGAVQRLSRGREYVVRLFRLDDALERTIATLSERVATLERQAADASPGQRYLLQRKLESERKAEVRRVASDAAREAYDTLGALAIEAVADELPRVGDATGGAAVLNAAFLVSHERFAAFQAAITEITTRREGQGFRVEFTGPWPPYHFTREAGHA